MAKNQLNKNTPDPKDKKPTHIVGIGASAGGLEAIENLVKNMSNNSGLAYVIVQHLSPDYKSLMADLLQKYTSMPIHRIEDGMALERDNIYLISPRKNIKVFHGKLLSVDREDRLKGQINLPIDTFFQSLAEDLGDKAIGIVLSGTGSDGTRGIRAIKENGGMTIAQTPESAKFDSMPNSAIATGLVDYVLPPEEMPQQLTNFVKHPYAKLAQDETAIPESDNGLARIFALLRERHRVDFTFYKPTTIIRRIERRIAVSQCQSLAEYTRYISAHPSEINTLFQEMLIGVTSFFRDEKVFNHLKSDIIPRFFEHVSFKSGISKEIRIWIAGCSTGEEAYSIAMLLHDYIVQKKLDFKVKIFATDVDPIAINKASMGIYPRSIVADVPVDYLSRFFVNKDEYFQINREVRESMVFAQHDLLKDPPFTNIDLISCRNLLIYLQPVLQKKVMELFNFSLKQEGVLLLGSSESIGEMEEFYEPLNASLKLFCSKSKNNLLGFPKHQMPKSWSAVTPENAKLHQESATLMRFTEERFYNRFITSLSTNNVLPLTLITDENMSVTHIYGESSEYLRYAPGKIVTDIGKIVIKQLSVPVTTGLQKCINTSQSVLLSNIKVKLGTDEKTLKTLEVLIFPIPKRANQEELYSVLIREILHSSENKSTLINYNIELQTEQRIADLEQELQFSRENLQATVEELETSNEELQATNEELLASNEELQSTNEELQSVNEELYTVNAEYQSKITELTIANTDMDNLFNSTNTAALFLDENGEIRRFTPKLNELIPILPSDLGRPITHLAIHLADNINLNKVIRRVMIDGAQEEHEFQLNDKRWHILRVTPYAISPTHSAGVVITIFNIDELKRAQLALLSQYRKEVTRLARIVENSDDAYIQYAPDGRILTWNKGAKHLYGYHHDVAIKKTIYNMLPPEEFDKVTSVFETINDDTNRISLSLKKFNEHGDIVDVVADLTAMRDEQGAMIITAKERLQVGHRKITETQFEACITGLLNTLGKDKALMIVNDRDILVGMNKHAEALFAFKQQHNESKSLLSLLDNNDEATLNQLKALLFSEVNSEQLPIELKNNEDAVIKIKLTTMSLSSTQTQKFTLLIFDKA